MTARPIVLVAAAALLALPGCARLQALVGGTGAAPATVSAPAPAPAAPARAPAPILAGPSATPAALDTVSEAEKDAARAAAAAAPAGGMLGEATVSLGDPADPGLWVKTGLVTDETPGTVRSAGGEAIAVTLRPLAGAGGAQISLPALRALGLPIAGLHPVTLARAD